MTGHGQNASGGKAPSKRQLRVGEEVRHALSGVMLRAGFRDPELINRAITVTEVRVSPDLKNATAYVLPLDGEAEPMVKALNRASAYLRGQLGQAIRLKYLPALTFVYDASFDEATRIETIMHSPEVARDLALEDRTEEGDS
ncbi:MAG: ribosome-binding factor A [Alphaproteobacteria bacterium]|nr:ribosome-binding factor A [Alphaproteobacteria bacterium]|tara:strand:+ start:2756 stop:3181 length:426 start_codon:yes stop_codon:yes gene_type:complete